MCANLDSSATLVTIGSSSEQSFINDMIDGFTVTTNNYWIGLEWSSSAWKWIDKSAVAYTNWGTVGAGGSKTCAKLTMTLLNKDGKWSEDTCTQQYLVICQKFTPTYL